MNFRIQRFWRRLGAIAGKARLAAEMIGQARKHYGGSYYSVGLRFLDVYSNVFPHPRLSNWICWMSPNPGGEIDELISKENMVRLQRSFNPVELTNQTENKLDFERLCAEAGLPSAKTVATVETRSCLSASLNGEELAGGDVISALVARLRPGAYVIKPRDGALGRGVRVFSCGDSAPEDTGKELKEHLDRHGDFDSWLVQPKLINHEDVRGSVLRRHCRRCVW